MYDKLFFIVARTSVHKPNKIFSLNSNFLLVIFYQVSFLSDTGSNLKESCI